MNGDQLLIRQFQRNEIATAPIETSPLAIALGGQIADIDPINNQIVLSFEPGEFFFQAERVIQGGVTAVMLDFAMAFAALAILPDDHSVATANLNISYLRAVKAGTLRSIGEIERRGRTLIFARARLLQNDGVVVATGTSTLSVIPTGTV